MKRPLRLALVDLKMLPKNRLRCHHRDHQVFHLSTPSANLIHSRPSIIISNGDFPVHGDEVAGVSAFLSPVTNLAVLPLLPLGAQKRSKTVNCANLIKDYT